MEATHFPIMLFDEKKLTPSFGYVFEKKWLDPYESIVSLLWKLARMNRLSGYNIISQLANAGVDPYEGVEALRSEVDMHRLQIALKLPLALIRETLIPDTLQSISSPHFRYCSKCIFRGYHGIIHQFETIRRCPVHGDKLKVVCDFCGTKARYRLNLNLLATPYRCGSCGRLYSSCLPSILHTRPLKLKDRIAITRLRLSHGSSY